MSLPVRPLILAAFGLALLPGAAIAEREPLPAATPAGKALNCIPIVQIRESRVRNDQVIDFVTRSGKVYRNTLPQSCPRLGFEERFGYQTSISQLCSTDIITVLNVTGPTQGASCGLGQFQPVTLAKTTAAR